VGVGGVEGWEEEEDLDVGVGLESVLLVVGDVEECSETGLEIPGELGPDSIPSIAYSWSVGSAEMVSVVLVSARRGNCVDIISSCSRTRAVLAGIVLRPGLAIRRRVRLGILRSRGISRSSSGGARSIAAKRDWSHKTKVSILWQDRRNWSASARTRITYFFLCGVSTRTCFLLPLLNLNVLDSNTGRSHLDFLVRKIM
jgi:hypothetical protein